MTRMAVGLGSSLGDRRRAVERAIAHLAAHPEVRLVRTSRWYRTPPMRGGTARGWFLNGVAVFDTALTPEAFLALCVDAERRAGRRRAGHWGDRTLDVDLLLAGDAIVDTPDLVVPHPAIARRPFVLVPLIEAWPDARDPVSGERFASFPVPAGPRPTPIGVLARRLPAE